MTIKKFLCFLFLSFSFLSTCYAQSPLGQSLQINTQLTKVYGKPTWLLIVRDVDSGKVSPYVFDIRNNDNYWIAFTFGHSYRITASSLTFGPYAKIRNFCNLEGGIITNQSYSIMVTGEMSPDPTRFKCHVQKFLNTGLPIANTE